MSSNKEVPHRAQASSRYLPTYLYRLPPSLSLSAYPSRPADSVSAGEAVNSQSPFTVFVSLYQNKKDEEEEKRSEHAAMLTLILLAALAGFSSASDVLEFTDADFKSRIVDHELILVEFYAPW